MRVAQEIQVQEFLGGNCTRGAREPCPGAPRHGNNRKRSIRIIMREFLHIKICQCRNGKSSPVLLRKTCVKRTRAGAHNTKPPRIHRSIPEISRMPAKRPVWGVQRLSKEAYCGSPATATRREVQECRPEAVAVLVAKRPLHYRVRREYSVERPQKPRHQPLSTPRRPQRSDPRTKLDPFTKDSGVDLCHGHGRLCLLCRLLCHELLG